MKALRKTIDKLKPHFEKGGKFQRFQSVFEGFETFLYVPDKVTTKGAHIRDSIDMKRTMSVVIMALMPALFFGMWNVGRLYFNATGQEEAFWPMLWYGFLRVFPIIVVSYVSGLAVEFYFAQVRGHEINEGFLVTGMLIPLIVPVDVPLWMVAVATVFAVIFGKEVFGGTGMNIMNPALLTRAFLFFAYPSKMSGDKIWVNGIDGATMNEAGQLVTKYGDRVIDGFTGATPLAEAAAGNLQHLPSIAEMFIGTIPGSIGETSTLCILLGAAFLIFTGVGSWKIMLSTAIGGLLMGAILNLSVGVNPFGILDLANLPEKQIYWALPAWYHLMLGGFAFGAVFMATDPVSAAQTERGKWIYGLLIGIMAILVRVLNPAFPEGMMLAILLLNVFAPLIDHYVVKGNIKRRLRRAKTAAQ